MRGESRGGARRAASTLPSLISARWMMWPSSPRSLPVLDSKESPVTLLMMDLEDITVARLCRELRLTLTVTISSSASAFAREEATL